MWRVTSASIRRSVRQSSQTAAPLAALFPSAAPPPAHATPLAASASPSRSPSQCPQQPASCAPEGARPSLNVDAIRSFPVAGASTWLRVQGGDGGAGWGMGGLRWRSTESGGGEGDSKGEGEWEGGSAAAAEGGDATVAAAGEAAGDAAGEAAGDAAGEAAGDDVGEGEASADPAESADPPAPPPAIAPYVAQLQGAGEMRARRRRQYGTYGDDIEEELEGFIEPEDEGEYRHLYDARGVVDKWLGDPALWGMVAGETLGEEEEEEELEGEGPELRWETRMVLGPGGSAWHPANRKVKVSVFVRELGLSPLARERLLALVGRRYNGHKDELTIVSERYRHREENRKDVFRILHEVIAEAKKADQLAVAAAAAAAHSQPATAAAL